ncbi:UNVERIFIED_CONTAM: Golgin candidate 5 [Sesamum indicum]
MASVVARLPSPPLVVVNGRKSVSGTLQKLAMPTIKERQGCRGVKAKATGESSETSIVKSVQNVWDNSEDRVALIGLGFAGVVGFWASINLIAAIDKLPIFPSVLELIGILYSTVSFSHPLLAGANHTLFSHQARAFSGNQQVDIRYPGPLRNKQGHGSPISCTGATRIPNTQIRPTFLVSAKKFAIPITNHSFPRYSIFQLGFDPFNTHYALTDPRNGLDFAFVHVVIVCLINLAGAVNKLSESVKNIEKNFDSALGLEEKSDATGSDSEATSGLWPTDRKALFEPIIGFMGQKGEESTVESLETSNASKPTSPVRTKQIDDDDSTNQVSAQIPHGREANEEKDSDVKTGFGEEIKDTSEEPKDHAAADNSGATVVLPPIPVPLSEEKPEEVKQTESANNLQEEERAEEIFPTLLESVQPESAKNLQEEVRLKEMSPTLIESVQPEPTSPGGKVEVVTSESTANDAPRFPEGIDEQNAEDEDVKEVFTAQSLNALPGGPAESRESSAPNIPDKTTNAEDNSTDKLPILHYNEMEASTEASDLVMPPNDTAPVSIELKQHLDKDANVKEQRLSTGSNSSDIVDSVAELEKVKKEMKMMETALHGAARQAQAKADEIAKLMNENEQLKAVIDDLRIRELEEEKKGLLTKLQEAETKAAAAEEKERSINERLTQTLSRINVLEAQISCLRAEQTQLTRSLEKERQRAAENRQEYLALKEEADTHESRAHQLEEEIRELRRKHKEELHEALMHQELLQKLEELRADIVDLKEMYREQVNLLVNKIQRLSSAIGTDLDDT